MTRHPIFRGKDKRVANSEEPQPNRLAQGNEPVSLTLSGIGGWTALTADLSRGELITLSCGVCLK